MFKIDCDEFGFEGLKVLNFKGLRTFYDLLIRALAYIKIIILKIKRDMNIKFKQKLIS